MAVHTRAYRKRRNRRPSTPVSSSDDDDEEPPLCSSRVKFEAYTPPCDMPYRDGEIVDSNINPSSPVGADSDTIILRRPPRGLPTPPDTQSSDISPSSGDSQDSTSSSRREQGRQTQQQQQQEPQQQRQDRHGEERQVFVLSAHGPDLPRARPPQVFGAFNGATVAAFMAVCGETAVLAAASSGCAPLNVDTKVHEQRGLGRISAAGREWVVQLERVAVL